MRAKQRQVSLLGAVPQASHQRVRRPAVLLISAALRRADGEIITALDEFSAKRQASFVIGDVGTQFPRQRIRRDAEPSQRLAGRLRAAEHAGDFGMLPADPFAGFGQAGKVQRLQRPATIGQQLPPLEHPDQPADQVGPGPRIEPVAEPQDRNAVLADPGFDRCGMPFDRRIRKRLADVRLGDHGAVTAVLEGLRHGAQPQRVGVQRRAHQSETIVTSNGNTHHALRQPFLSDGRLAGGSADLAATLGSSPTDAAGTSAPTTRKRRSLTDIPSIPKHWTVRPSAQ